METVFDKKHQMTTEEKIAVLGFEEVTPEYLEGWNQRDHYGLLHNLYTYRGNERMAKYYADLIPNDVRKVFGLLNHDHAISREKSEDL